MLTRRALARSRRSIVLLRLSSLCAVVTMLAIAACFDRSPTAPRTNPQGAATTDRGALDPNKMAQLRRYGDGGCAATSIDGSGQVHGFAIQRQNMPFKIEPIQRDPQTGLGNGKRVQMVVSQPGAAPVTMYCWVPSTMTLDDLASNALKTSRNGRWKSVLTRVKNGRSIPEAGKRSPLSAEAQAFEAEVLAASSRTSASGMASANHNDGCVDVRAVIEYYWEEGDAWFTVTVEFTDCDSGGGGDVFCWVIDNGYDDPPHVVVDANAYEVMGTDSVTFTAEVVSTVHLPAVGWTWVPANGTSWDPWTQACSGTATTCKIQVHGTGRMYYTVQDAESNNITGNVRVIADTAPEIDDVSPDDAGDTDISTPSVTFATYPISAAQGTAILAEAKSQPNWVYTQGCYHCNPNLGYVTNHPDWTEPPKNLANHYGDCTDFVWTVARNVLGSTSWPFGSSEIARTVQFQTFTSSTAGYYGYVIIDSAQAREGDVVLLARVDTGGSPAHTIYEGGHVGIFVQWVAGPNGGYPNGWANNGKPASPAHPNSDGTTGIFHFRRKDPLHDHVYFFRQATP